jgi:hypothetical protein
VLVTSVANTFIDLAAIIQFVQFGYESHHHFDHHLGLSIEILLSAKSLLWKIEHVRTSLDALPYGGQAVASSNLASPTSESEAYAQIRHSK